MKNFLLLLLFCSGFAKAQINPQNISIARDSFGVPHILRQQIQKLPMVLLGLMPKTILQPYKC
jgi:hypothetical protein